VHRRFQQWCREEVLRAVLTDLANTLREQGQIDEEECFIDAMFSSAKGGGAEIGPTRRGKGVKIMGICRSRRLAARGEHVRSEPSQGHAGAADVRVLHDRSEA
jgi:hypothetical protein